MHGAVTARREHCAVDGRSTTPSSIAEHLATHKLITADLGRRVVDLVSTTACAVFTDRRGPAARRADAGIGAADVRTEVVDCVTAACRVRRGQLLDRSVAAEMGGWVIRGYGTGTGRRAHAVVVSLFRAAVDGRTETSRTDSVVGATYLFVLVVDRQAAARRPLIVNPTSDRRFIATYLPCRCKYTQ